MNTLASFVTPTAKHEGQSAVAGRSVLVRMLYGSLGVTFLTIAFIGIFLPGIPTTGPLLVASFFLVRCSPKLERRLVQNRVFGKYLEFLGGARKMPWKAKIWAMVWMWTSISISTAILVSRSSHSIAIVASMVSAGVVGSLVIAMFQEWYRVKGWFGLRSSSGRTIQNQTAAGMVGEKTVLEDQLLEDVQAMQGWYSPNIAPSLDENARSRAERVKTSEAIGSR